jgi:hypothetical protein
MSSGFGQWYEEKKAEENGDSQRSSSWFNSDEVLPLFTTESISWSGMKESMESQMPKKIMGMGYQQRFKVRQLIAASAMLHMVPMRSHTSHTHDSHFLLSPSLATGLLRPPLSIRPLFCTGLFRGPAHACRPTAEIRLVFYLWKFDVYGILWNSQGTR